MGSKRQFAGSLLGGFLAVEQVNEEGTQLAGWRRRSDRSGGLLFTEIPDLNVRKIFN